MRFFKHYVSASHSNSLTKLIAETGLEGYGRYWRLLELMGEKFDGEEDVEFVFSIKDLKDILGFYHLNSLRKYLECVANVCGMSLEWSDNVVTIYSPILLELQSRDFKRARKGRAETAPKNKNKNKNKNKIKKKNIQKNGGEPGPPGGEKTPPPANPTSQKTTGSVLAFERSRLFDFQALYELYPRKQKRGEALAVLTGLVDSEELFEQVRTAILNYRSFAEREKTPFEYLMTLPRFLDEWRDWLDPDNGTSTLAVDESEFTLSRASILESLEGAENEVHLEHLIEQIRSAASQPEEKRFYESTIKTWLENAQSGAQEVSGGSE